MKKDRLAPFEVVCFIYTAFPDVAKKVGQNGLKYALGVKESSSTISRYLHGRGTPPPSFFAAVEDKANQMKLAQAFGLYEGSADDGNDDIGALSGFSEDELRARLSIPSHHHDKADDHEPDNVPDFVHIKAASPDPASLTPWTAPERDALQSLADRVATANKPIIHWSALRFSGANVLARSLMPWLAASGTQQIFAISPSNVDSPYDAELEQTARTLTGRAHGAAHHLVDALIRDKALIVVNHLEVLEGVSRNNLLNSLLQELRSRRSLRQPVILLVGKASCPWLKTPLSPATCLAVEQNVFESVAAGERFGLFLEQYNYFLARRNLPVDGDDNGFRVKRARLRLEANDSPEIWPIDIRLLALFASNLDNNAYLDPTGGFDRLVGESFKDLPLQILIHRREVKLYLRHGEVRERKARTRLLRWMSTAIYWLTDDALKILAAAHSRNSEDGGLEQDINYASEVVTQIEIHDPAAVGGRAKTRDAAMTGRAYIAPLALKAIVQDRWKKEDAPDRAMAHFRVARMLWIYRDRKELLSREFPFQPHWGRSRMFFLSECLRHLMRSVGGAAPSTAPAEPPDLTAVIDTRHGFLKASGSVMPTTPEILQFCYGILFAELNGTHANSSPRHLSTRHGAYHLAAELLQLMGTPGDRIRPHWALSHRLEARYYNDVAFAKLDLGELPDALACFERSTELYLAKGATEKHCENLLNKALVHTVKGTDDDLAQAKVLIDRAAGGIPPRPDLGQEDRHAYVRTRIIRRQAQIEYLEDRFDNALALYSKIGLAEARGEMAHVVIAALNRKEPKDRQLAMQICISNLFENTSAGWQHPALGFRISLAHLLRKMGMATAADDCLNLVHHDIYRYGCSERTYLSFLLEAGRNLIERENAPRAYCVYLKPCFERARRRGIRREAVQARTQALKALRLIRELHIGDDVLARLKTLITSKRMIIDDRARPSLPGALPQDLLASYDVPRNEESLINLIIDDAAIQREIDSLETY